MKNTLQYKGYFSKIEYSVEDRVLYGKIEGIKDLVNFESESIENIEQEFKNAVDDYLELCKELNQEPDKAYSGTFNVRISPSLHRTLAMNAIKEGESLNSMVEKAIDSFVNDNTNTTVKAIWDKVSENQYYNPKNSNASSNITPVNRYWSNNQRGLANV